MSSKITALRDDWIMRSMLSRVGDIPESVLLPMLRQLADNSEAVDAGWEALIATRIRPRARLAPRESWRRRYGQFVRELEWAITGLVEVLPRDDVEHLVSDAVASRLRRWLRILLPAFNTVTLVPRGLYPSVMDAGVSVATFLVGPIQRSGVEPDGTLVYEIPECAMHTATETGVAQEHSCLMACKAACEKVFDKDSAMPLEFDPHLPGLSCTLRVHPAASHPNR
ncbi:hypothetical protein K3U94_18690 [Mycolicibacter heraklionensis]|uniref:Uncharacterized protein n=1 Tax=Mycolicibacter heraklionensis TaxID=512402 RepID=A0A9X7ZFY7_9MYCO|nr:hypothetical protein [Mycolicibacter heraklionensis]QZA06982.1 hypothetical protein K3U94_18690 [Mycolicibacter heraklionensis]